MIINPTQRREMKMKAQMKAIMASAVVIALCLAAVGGVTYSWFSDSEESEITIQSGRIVLDLDVVGMTVKSYGSEAIDVPLDNTPVTTALKGQVRAIVDDSDEWKESLTIVFNNAAPGDSVSFRMDGTLLNTINVQYNEAISITERGLYTEDHPFIVSGITPTATPVSYEASESANPISNDITIKMDEDAGNEYQNRTYVITLTFEAYQANYDGNLTQTHFIQAGSAQNISVSNKDVGSAIDIEIPAGAFTNPVNLTATAISAVDASDGSYNIVADNEVLGGVDVAILDNTTEQYIHDLTSPATVKMTIPLTANSIITVCHNGTDLPTTAGSGAYVSFEDIDSDEDGNVDKTVITIHNVTEFSSYIAYNKNEAKIGGTHYATLEDAIAAAKTGSTIKLLKDAAIDSQVIIEGKVLTIDCGKRAITSSIENTLFVIQNGAKVTFNNGRIVTSDAPVHIVNGGEATFNNTAFSIGDSIYVSTTDKKVSEYDYTDKLTLNNVVIDSTYGAICGFTKANITINGGTITDHIGGGLLTNGTKGLGGQTWKVKGVTFNIGIEEQYDPTAADYIAVGIQCHNTGTWNISDCTFNMKNGVALSVRGGEVNVSNCTYNYISVPGYNQTGKLQFTDTVVDVTVPHAIDGIYFANGAYGYTAESKLTINGTVQTIAAPDTGSKTSFEFDFPIAVNNSE